MEVVDIQEILSLIPHRYPLLLVDKIIDVKPNESATGIKNVTFNEPHFLGHFPNHPIMPGVLIIEAMAQTSAVLVAKTLGDSAKGKLVYFMSIEEAKFRKPVVPGDKLVMHVIKEKHKANVWKFKGECFVDETKVAESIFTAMIMEK